MQNGNFIENVNMSETEPKTNFEMKKNPGTLQAGTYMYQQFKKRNI